MESTTWSHPFGPSLEKNIESTFTTMQKPFAEVQNTISKIEDQEQREAIVGLTISTLLRTSRVSNEFLVAGLDAVQCDALVAYQQSLVALVPEASLVTPVAAGGLRR